ncbi:MAG: tetratricopeptide repeat protein [Gemmataceae bacterium]|nr:tetratricopeptide repeat protein [Gemmataceae bacterium]
MSVYITCPRCHASLKANKLPAETRTVACPECHERFQVASTGITAAIPQPKIPAAAPEAQPEPQVAASLIATRTSPWLAIGVIASILLVGGGVIAAIVFTRQPPPPAAPPVPVAVVKETVVKETEGTPPVDEKDNDDKRRQDFIRLMIEGGTSLNSQRFDEAVSAYTEAVKLSPDDADARQKLSEAQAGLGKQRQAKLDDDKKRADALQLVKKGQGALDEKQYAAAVDLFKLAVDKNPSLAEATQGLIAARAALQRDQLDQKRIAEYEQLILAGKAAMKAGRYADAIRDFMSAQRVVPDDPIAQQFQREAEKQLDGLMNRAEKQKEFQRLLEQATTAMKAKSYEDAEKAYQRALRLFPNDATAQEGIEDAQKALKQTKTEYAAWMLRGNAAGQAGRFGEAALAFREATRLFPTDEAAARALRQAELAQENQNIYFRAMDAAGRAMSFKQYADAIVAYNEALRAAPGDFAALQGLRDAQQGFEADAGRRKEFERRATIGFQLLKSQRYADAAVELRAALKAMRHHPQAPTVDRQADYAEAMANATAAMNARRYGDAIGHFEAALREFPNDFAARNGRNRALQLNQKNKGGKS